MNTPSADKWAARPLPRRRADVQVNDLGSETVLYDVAKRRVHALNEAGRFIWDRCDGITLFQELVDAMGQRFAGVTRDVLVRDVESVLDLFSKEALLDLPER